MGLIWGLGMSDSENNDQAGDAEGIRQALTPELREFSTWHLGVAGDLASACALGGAREEALELLEHAIDLGWCHPDFWGRYDQCFVGLHDDQRFRQLIAGARQRVAGFGANHD